MDRTTSKFLLKKIKRQKLGHYREMEWLPFQKKIFLKPPFGRSNTSTALKDSVQNDFLFILPPPQYNFQIFLSPHVMNQSNFEKLSVFDIENSSR